MTDGANNISLAAPSSEYGGLRHSWQNKEESDQLTAEICTDVKSDSVTIYTIALEVDDASTKTLMENCATSSEHYFDVENSSRLTDIFNDIAIDVAKIRIAYLGLADFSYFRLHGAMKAYILNVTPDLIREFP